MSCVENPGRQARYPLRPAAWAIAAFLLILSGCAPLSTKTSPLTDASSGWTRHVAQVLAFDPVTLSARVAVQDAEQGGTFKIRWTERAGLLDLLIEPPVGGGRYTLREYAGGVELATADGVVASSRSADGLVEAYLSITLPVEGVRYWIKGIPDPRYPMDAGERTADGLLADFAQGRWRVSILEYREVNGVLMPRRLFLTRDDVQVRIAVDQWRLGT